MTVQRFFGQLMTHPNTTFTKNNKPLCLNTTACSLFLSNFLIRALLLQ